MINPQELKNIFGKDECALKEAIKHLIQKHDVFRKYLYLLGELKDHSEEMFIHSLRVGLWCYKLGLNEGKDENLLLKAGLFHDIGKIIIPYKILNKKAITDADMKIIRKHPTKSYRIIDKIYRESGDERSRLVSYIVGLHHWFQENHYPEKLPWNEGKLSPEEDRLVWEYGKIVAIADCYDALHRNDGKFTEEKTPEFIRKKLEEIHPESIDMIRRAYDAGIFFN